MMQSLTALGQRLLRPHAADDTAPLVPGPGQDAERPRPTVVTNAPMPASGAYRTAARSLPLDPSAAYALPRDQGRLIVELLRLSGRALHPDYAHSPDTKIQEALHGFYTRRTQLLSEALTGGGTTIFTVRGSAPPSLSRCRTTWDVLGTLLHDRAGLVIGTLDTHRAAEQLLIDNIKVLRKLGVDTLYVDRLQHDLHQRDIDALHRTGRAPRDLLRFIDDLDGRHVALGLGRGSLQTLVDAADRAGLRVVALDMAVSYHLKGAAHPDEGRRMEPADIRARVSSHTAAARIRHDQATQPAKPGGPGRWVALMSSAGAGFHNGNPGVGARLGVPSLRVEDVPSGRSSTLRAGFDPGLSLQSAHAGAGRELQCDHLLKVPRLDVPATVTPTPEPCSAAEADHARALRRAMVPCARDLMVPGTYRIVQMDGNGLALVHRSGRGHLVAQPIDAVRGGGVRLRVVEGADPARWRHVQGKFDSLDALRAALSTRMEEVPVRVPGLMDR